MRDVLDVTAFEHPRDYGEHFKTKYGPTIAARANAAKTGREAELDEALNRFCDEWNRGTADDARFGQEYLLAVGTRAQGLVGRRDRPAWPSRSRTPYRS